MKRLIIYVLLLLVYKLIILILFKLTGSSFFNDFFDMNNLKTQIDSLNNVKFYNSIIFIYSTSYIFTVFIFRKKNEYWWSYIIISVVFYVLISLPIIGIRYLFASFFQYFPKHVLLHLVIITLFVELLMYKINRKSI